MMLLRGKVLKQQPPRTVDPASRYLKPSALPDVDDYDEGLDERRLAKCKTVCQRFQKTSFCRLLRAILPD